MSSVVGRFLDFFDEFLLGNDGALVFGDGVAGVAGIAEGDGARGERNGVYASGAEFGLGSAGFGS